MQNYFDNRYWTLWKLPMFGCSDPVQVIAYRQPDIAPAASFAVLSSQLMIAMQQQQPMLPQQQPGASLSVHVSTRLELSSRH